jgi:tetratricopeptide (TPR) repeat protein
MLRVFGIAAIAAWFLMSTAMAAEKPEIGPVEAWIHQAPVTPEPMKAATGAALASLLQDVQVRFDAQGLVLYQAGQIKVQTAQGLQAFSTIGLAWSPATDRLIVNRLRILRGDQAIDVLPKDGVFTIARREERLDSEGQLDGVLTAIIKIDGLQIGDIVDLAYTVHRNDPLFKNRVDQVLGMADTLPISFDRIRLIWPETTPSHWRVSGGMPEPHVIHRDGYVDAEIIIDGVTPLIKPQGAPARFQRGREISLSNYNDWTDVSAAMAPLFASATKLKPSSPLKLEAAAITAKTGDPKLRAAAALSLVQDRIRYLAQTLGEGGYKPATADDTWDRRYGDCKAKTAMLLALLNELGIKAEPVLVSTKLGEDLDAGLPSLSVFDHVVVRAVIEGRDYWLDGTRAGDLSLSALTTPDYGYVLPVRASGGGLMHVRPDPLALPQTSEVVHLDASKGLSAPALAHVETTLRGDAATAMRLAIANLAPAELDRQLRNYWHENYDYITVTAVKATFDPVAGEEKLTMDGDATLDWSGGYEPDGAVLGWKMDTLRDAAATHPDAPFALVYPFYIEHEDTVVLPDHGKGFSVWGENIDRQLAGYALNRQASITDGVFHMKTSMRSLAPEISYTQAKSDAEPLTSLSKTTLRINVPTQAGRSSADLKALMATEPTTFDAYLARGCALLDVGRYQEALHDFDRAVQINPKSAVALGDRAVAHAWLGQAKEALADADLAEPLDPREATIYRARGLIAEKNGDWQTAIANYTRSVDLQPNTFSYRRRAQDYSRIKDYQRALRDLDADLVLEPDAWWPHVEKASVYIQMKEPEKARSEIDAVKSAAADNDTLRADRLALLVELGDRNTARIEADASVSAHPTAVNYLQRIRTRAPEDLAGAEADAVAAHAADPKNVLAVRYLALYRKKAKDYAAARAWDDNALVLAPDDLGALVDRAQLNVKLGRLDAARADFAAVRIRSKADANMLNNLCYDQATVAFDLTQALADCDASLALQNTPQTLDSRGFVLLRLGQNRDAKAAFDQALAMAPQLAPSLYGRSLVERRLGDTAAADKDKEAALANNAKIAELFGDYGVTN